MGSSVVTVTLNASVDRTVAVPSLTPYAVNSGELVAVLPAGKGVNIARLLGMLGLDTIASGFIGESEETIYREHLSARGVDPVFVTLNSRTRANTTIIDRSCGMETHVREKGASVGPRDIERLYATLGRLISAGSSVVFSGGLPSGMSADDLAGLLQAVRDQGGSIYLDMDHAWANRNCSHHATVIKPNEQELRLMLNDRVSSVNDLMRKLRDFRSELSLVTCGAGGAFLVDAMRCLHANVVASGSISRTNSVGCGDAFLGGYLFCQIMGRTDDEALRFACACGVACLASPTAEIADVSVIDSIAEGTEVRTVIL